MSTETKTPVTAAPPTSFNFIKLKKAGVPLAGIECSDPAAAIVACRLQLNGGETEIAIYEWDTVRGLRGINPRGVLTAADIGEPLATINPVACLEALPKAPENSICFYHWFDQFANDPTVVQGLWNLRDPFKGNKRMIVLLAPNITPPEALKNDLVIIPHDLPGTLELEAQITKTVTDAQLDPDKIANRSKVVEALRGLSLFGAETILSMSLNRKEIVDLPQLQKFKRAYVSKQAGVEIREDKITFADIAGYSRIKDRFTRKIKGKRPPDLILWVDEMEKAFAAAGSDTSGTTQDQVGSLLTWIQDKLNADKISAALLVGFPGTGKSLITMALRNEAKCECLRLDMGGMKSSLVGSSEARIRNALKMIDAMSAGHILLVGTCNSVANIPSAMISRFAFGTFFFDLPDADENAQLWKLKRERYNIPADEKTPDSIGWTGREINQCCFSANDLETNLADAALGIAPFCKTGTAEIDQLRRAATGKYLSATKPGLYTYTPKEATAQQRKIEI